MEKIKNFIRIPFMILFLPLTIGYGSRRLRKWVNKNKREQDSSIYPFSKRWEYVRKKTNSFIRYSGIKVKVEGLENLPKGASWITPNHTSNFDGFYIIKALGGKAQLTPIAKDNLQKSFGRGYFIGTDTMFLDRKSPRQALTLLSGAAQYAKHNNRGIVIFPEGTRSLTTELLDFKAGLFKFPQKYFLPIVPITITGTLQAKKLLSLKSRIVTVTVHKPLKAMEHSKLPTEIIAKRVKDIIQTKLIQYEKSMSESERKKFLKLKQKTIKKDQKRNQELEKELRG